MEVVAAARDFVICLANVNPTLDYCIIVRVVKNRLDNLNDIYNFKLIKMSKK